MDVNDVVRDEYLLLASKVAITELWKQLHHRMLCLDGVQDLTFVYTPERSELTAILINVSQFKSCFEMQLKSLNCESPAMINCAWSDTSYSAYFHLMSMQGIYLAADFWWNMSCFKGGIGNSLPWDRGDLHVCNGSLC